VTPITEMPAVNYHLVLHKFVPDGKGNNCGWRYGALAFYRCSQPEAADIHVERCTACKPIHQKGSADSEHSRDLGCDFRGGTGQDPRHYRSDPNAKPGPFDEQMDNRRGIPDNMLHDNDRGMALPRAAEATGPEVARHPFSPGADDLTRCRLCPFTYDSDVHKPIDLAQGRSIRRDEDARSRAAMIQIQSQTPHFVPDPRMVEVPNAHASPPASSIDPLTREITHDAQSRAAFLSRVERMWSAEQLQDLIVAAMAEAVGKLKPTTVINSSDTGPRNRVKELEERIARLDATLAREAGYSHYEPGAKRAFELARKWLAEG
jgi:hypothetical protein